MLDATGEMRYNLGNLRKRAHGADDTRARFHHKEGIFPMVSPDSTTFSIYRIVCFQTGEVYVGQTNSIKTRRRAHFSTLRGNRHHNLYLQRSFNKYGEKSFYFEVLETGLDETAVDSREQYWIEYFDCCEKGF